MALCCILFSMIMYLLYWRTQNGHNDQCVVSTVLKWEEGTSPSICWQYLSRYPGYHCYFLVFFSFSKFHFWFTFSSLTTRTTQICFCRFTFQLDGSQHVLVPEVVLPQVQDCISPCWTSWCSSQSHSPAWQCLSSGWHHDYLVHLTLHLVLCHLKTCWGYTLFHPPKVNENVKHFQSSSLIVFHIYQLCPDIQKGQNHNENCGKRKKERSPINALIWRKKICILSSHP